jgi:hypothetical protein
MAIIPLSVIVALSLSGTSVVKAPEPGSLLRAVQETTVPIPGTPGAGRGVEAWMIDRPEQRPAALPALYASLGALHALDAYSTRRAMAAGAYEANPTMGKAAGNAGATLALKAASTAGTIFFAERAWKKNRKGAIILMAAINGAMAAVSARNFRNAQLAQR